MFTALMLILNTVLHIFTSLALCYTVLQLLSLRCTHTLISHDNPVLLNTGRICHLCISQILDCLPVSLLEASGTLSLSLEGTGILAVLTSEALWVTTSLGAVAFCYHIYALPIAVKSFHLAYTSSCTCIIQITTIIL